MVGLVALSSYAPPISVNLEGAQVDVDFSEVLAQLENGEQTAIGNATAAGNHHNALMSGVNGLDSRLSSLNTLTGTTNTLIGQLTAANQTGDAGITAAIASLEGVNAAAFASADARYAAIEAAVNAVKGAVEASEVAADADRDALIARLDQILTALADLQAVALEIKLELEALNATALELKTEVGAQGAAVVAAIQALQATTGTNTDDLEAAIAANQASIVAAIAASQNAVESKLDDLMTEAAAIRILAQDRNTTLATLVAKADSLLSGIDGMNAAIVAKLQEMLNELDSEERVVKIEREAVDATLAEKIYKAPQGSLGLTAYSVSGHNFYVSLDQGSTWLEYLPGETFHPQSTGLKDHDVSVIGEVWFKFPVGSKGRITGQADDSTYDIVEVPANGGAGNNVGSLRATFDLGGGAPVFASDNTYDPTPIDADATGVMFEMQTANGMGYLSVMVDSSYDNPLDHIRDELIANLTLGANESVVVAWDNDTQLLTIDFVGDVQIPDANDNGDGPAPISDLDQSQCIFHDYAGFGVTNTQATLQQIAG